MRGVLLGVLAVALLSACGGTSKNGQTPPRCGDGHVDTGEACDKGAANSDTLPDACRTDCTLARCGDGVADKGEACDDGADNSDDKPNKCRTTCTLPRCGDGVKDNGEACDAGAANSDTAPDACRTTCVMAVCGDGVVDAGEECDAKNKNDDNGACTTACKNARCGDDLVETGVEECDNGTDNSATVPDACRPNCKNAACGDGVTDSGEACDDGNTVNDDGCSNACTTPSCGDGIVQTGEACDDGAANSDTTPDACRTSCHKPRCGDSVTDTGEECDTAARNDTGPCTSQCRNARCGDGFVEAGVEQCDQGASNSDTLPNACRTTCRRSYCGDGVIDMNEVCDDGNTAAGDGCSPTCQKEPEEVEPNDSQGTATAVKVGDYTRGTISPETDVDYFSFDAKAGKSYYVRIWAGSIGGCTVSKGEGDNTYLEVVGKAIDQVNDDAFFAGPCSEMLVTLASDGTYFVDVASADGKTIDPYWLEITEAGAESEPNDDRAGANAVAVRHTTEGAIGAGDHDYYAFQGKAGVTYTILTYAGELDACYPVNGNSSEATLSVYDADGNLQGSDDGDGLAPCSMLSFTPEADGTYFVEVSGPDTIDPYFVQVQGP